MKNYAKLRVKIRSLAAEAQIIRHEENKIPRPKNELFFSLRRHRVFDVRQEARHALLAYAYLRGRPYSIVEQPKSKPFDAIRVAELVRKFGGDPSAGDVKQCREYIRRWAAGERPHWDTRPTEAIPQAIAALV